MNPKYKCLYCQYTASRLWNLKRHLQSVHCNNKLNDCGNSDDIIQHHQYKYQQSQEQHQSLPYKKASSMRQPEFHTKSECSIHPSEYRSIQQHQQTFDEEQKSRNGSNQFQGYHITYDETKSRDEIIQEKQQQLFEYDKNIVEDKYDENLEIRRRYFIDLCSLNEWDIIRHMSECSDKYISVICEACDNLLLNKEIRRKPWYEYITVLANENENIQYKRRILQEKGIELVYLINTLILPSLMKTIKHPQLLSNENARRFKNASTQYSDHDRSYSQMSYDATKSRDENCKKKNPVVITSKGVFIL